MDRNFLSASPAWHTTVATREGGVDRNNKCVFERQPKIQVATREGGVDRNIPSIIMRLNRPLVATREGGVDRNVADHENQTIIPGRHPRGWRG